MMPYKIFESVQRGSKPWEGKLLDSLLLESDECEFKFTGNTSMKVISSQLFVWMSSMSIL